MKIEIKDVKKDVVQYTTPDERWYGIVQEDESTKWLPSSTWIAGYYPKGFGFEKWLADKGMDEAERIKIEAGNRGSKVHKAIEDLIGGQTVRHDSVYVNADGKGEDLTVDEYEAILSFANWWGTLKNPKVLKVEETVVNTTEGYAGTLDLLVEIDGEVWIVDFKTSANVYASHKIQISSYKHCDNMPKEAKMAILQVGYKRNKNKYKFTEIEDQFDLFLAAKKIWANEVSMKEPPQRELPLEIKLKKHGNQSNKAVGK